MTSDELTTRCTKLFGLKHWKKILAELLGSDFTTVRRWARGASPIPKYVVAILDLTEKQRELSRIISRLSKLQ